MQLQIFDFILIGIMALSGILALARGFTREVLSLIAWGLSALAAFYAIQQQKLIDLAMPYVDKPILAQVAVGAAAFIVTLVIVSIISVRLSDWVVDSAVGPFDRTLGFLYGLARGLVFVAIGYLLYGWLQPPNNQEDWIRNAQSLPIVQSTADVIVSVIARINPDAAANLRPPSTISNAEGAVTAPESGTNLNSDQQGLGNLIEGQQQAPAQGEAAQQ